MLTTRRQFLSIAGAGAGLALLGSCAGRPVRAPAHELILDASPMRLDLAGRTVTTWGYNAIVPGPEIRLRQGETLRVRLENRLPEDTTVHWHGLPVVNAMDGVAGLTQPPVIPGGGFDYEFVVPKAGSFMYHAHVGHQLDRGLYGPLIVEPDREELSYDREYTLMLDDWRDGLTPEPDGPPHGDHDEPDTTSTATDVSFGGRRYPLLLVNGRPGDDPAAFEVARGDRVRLRVMNIGADTGFRFAVAGHRLTVTHSDGMPVAPVTVDALRLGMGERYDVLIDANNPGAWQVAVLPEGRRGFGRAILRYTGTSGSAAPAPNARPVELTGRLLSYDDLVGTGPADFPTGASPDRSYVLTLSGMAINGQRYPDAEPLPVTSGEWVRVTMRNRGVKWHPMHLHGHHVRVATAGGRDPMNDDGPLKDTVSVPGGGGEVTVDMRADNPGKWLFHCHNHYHMEEGMLRVVEYV